MKKLSTSLLFLLVVNFCFAQETDYKIYSYTELFEMIETETDSLFTLENATIVFNPKTDQRFNRKTEVIDTLVVNKNISLNNVIFDNESNFTNIHFKKEVKLEDCFQIFFSNCIFDQATTFINSGNSQGESKTIKSGNAVSQNIFDLTNNTFNNGLKIILLPQNNILEKSDILYNIINNKIYNTNAPSFYGYKKQSFDVTLVGVLMLSFINNYISTGSNGWSVSGFNMEAMLLKNNTFQSDFPGTLSFDKIEEVQCTDNTFNQTIWLKLSGVNDPYIFSWNDFSGRLLNHDNFFDGLTDLQSEAYQTKSDSIINLYKNSIRVKDPLIYQGEQALLSKFLNHFHNIRNSESANAVYTEIKDLETLRLGHLYKENPNFKTFFTWKINQFLKVFSGYGTEPARAVIFSLYVILCFALIYLFFPNSWDKHGKNRIVDRYNFFFKYMKRTAGIHEVYLEDQQEEIMSYDQFKDNILSSEKKVPKFFTATALPLYKWAISGTKLSASLLKRIDIMKGTWSELPTHKRFWKSILLVVAFIIAVLYDIGIKMLNALMLSINTFTTLGFGEIPIKGLPRYLAIIQGFIGWFMLTIFSVSLISQLLN